MGMCTACSEESVRIKPSSKRKPAAKAKVAKVMDEYASGDLKSSSGEPIRRKDQAIAVALSEGRRAAKKK
jgi:Family of unknown function (DUF6496)